MREVSTERFNEIKAQAKKGMHSPQMVRDACDFAAQLMAKDMGVAMVDAMGEDMSTALAAAMERLEVANGEIEQLQADLADAREEAANLRFDLGQALSSQEEVVETSAVHTGADELADEVLGSVEKAEPDWDAEDAKTPSTD